MEQEALSRILAEVLHVDRREVDAGMTLEGDLDADSLDLYQILLKTEEEFNVSISEKECRSLRTVQDILHLIRKKGTVHHD